MTTELDAMPRILGCRSDELAGGFEGDFVLHLASGLTTLKAGDDNGRHQLIAAIRGGAHAELDATATTFRQKDGAPNRRFLRHCPEALGALASSFVGMPLLIDHASHSQRARMGTIKTSELHEHGGTGWSSFKMGLRVVKPEGVISVLDGTMDRFSIGWLPTGPVLCSVHKVNVRSSGRCGCWPGDVVEMDGAKHVVEYEFQSADGTEVSSVNVPAVKGTGVHDIRAALAAELHLSPIEIVQPRKETVMLTRLAAVLGLSALTAAEEDRAVQIFESERRGRLAAEQERDTLRTELDNEKKSHSATRLAVGKVAIDGVINELYRAGKLRYGRDSEGAATASRFEPMLRKLGESSIEALRAEAAEMPVIVPIGQRALADNGGEGAEYPADDGLTASELKMCTDLGIKPEDYAADKRKLRGEEE